MKTFNQAIETYLHVEPTEVTQCVAYHHGGVPVKLDTADNTELAAVRLAQYVTLSAWRDGNWAPAELTISPENWETLREIAEREAAVLAEYIADNNEVAD
jgi:uncharacterized protein YfaT (DUF1175 family)